MNIYFTFLGQLAYDKDGTLALQLKVPGHFVRIHIIPVVKKFQNLPFNLSQPIAKETLKLRSRIGGRFIGITCRRNHFLAHFYRIHTGILTLRYSVLYHIEDLTGAFLAGKNHPEYLFFLCDIEIPDERIQQSVEKFFF